MSRMTQYTLHITLYILMVRICICVCTLSKTQPRSNPLLELPSIVLQAMINLCIKAALCNRVAPSSACEVNHNCNKNRDQPHHLC